ncbi:MAG: cytochrome C oxidase subunit IV [Sulfobacillus thermosulfidooxidans]|uniref:cytochrome C oxidase subunit IV family protein n=1 Tax=Sulfobacillus TaxID=28033 RepID=UPI000CD0B733|nr:cytochrome C oxidase subunit IV family protein [Sulfobacillus sp. hq2]MCY0908814.1 cytochrome C oxidase subunit IV family protein [Sulfobacillus thermotolerans]POB09902.1 cytochrome C oxidase subunit IV [Sulfobacillus sp. hq2]PSR36073.1 MAG: cytochrome C oxidase subunit IV [Sulfobacillus thermosulfidooxidans]
MFNRGSQRGRRVIAISPNGPTGNGDEVEARFLAPHFESEGFPWLQIFGYIGSLLLTIAALLAVVQHILSPIGLLTVILILAVAQAALQLGIFMHLRESRGSTWHIITLGLGIVIALGLVGMSMWIMTFKSGVS